MLACAMCLEQRYVYEKEAIQLTARAEEAVNTACKDAREC